MAARVTVVAATLLLVPALRADASLHGTVRDATGAAIADAHLAATRPAGAAPCETTSAADGTFTLDCVSPPDVVRIEALGFTPVELTARDSLHVVLMPAAYTEAVVVTASRAEGVTTSGAAPVSVLASSDLALLPPAPLDDALKMRARLQPVPPHDVARRQSDDAGGRHARPVGLGREPRAGPRRRRAAERSVRRLGLLEPRAGGGRRSRRGDAWRRQRLYGADAMAGVVQVLTRRPGDASAEGRSRGRLARHAAARRSLPADHAARGGARRRPRPSRRMATSSCPRTSAGRST